MTLLGIQIQKLSSKKSTEKEVESGGSSKTEESFSTHLITKFSFIDYADLSIELNIFCDLQLILRYVC